jgi:acetyl esterase/lipase
MFIAKTPLIRLAVLGAVLLGLGACSRFDVLNFVGSDHAHKVEPTISYGEDPRQKLDILTPKDDGGVATRPVVIFLYGGGWTSGAREDYRFAGAALVKLGYVAVIPDYRLYPQVKFPDFMTDAARALAWVRANIYRYGGDPQKVFVMGHSAGAHMAALLALDPTYTRAADLPDNAIKGVIGLAGPYAMVPSQVESVREVFAGSVDEESARAVHFANTAAPPMLLLYGLDDDTVARQNAPQLADILRRAGRDVTLREYPDIGHAGMALALSPFFSRRAPVLEDIQAFVTRVASP